MARNPKQDANLKPFQKGDLTSEEAKKRGRSGGVKSGKARRARRDAKSTVRYLLELAAKGKIADNLKELGFPVNEQTNMAALQARLFTMAMGGNLDAYTTLMRMAGYEPEENRKERESIAADRRRELELDAKVAALSANSEGMSASVNMSDEDGNNDVVIYMPQIASEESCEMEEEAGKPDTGETDKAPSEQ
ncbi:hypothetical protein [Anaerotruncus colihominis]|uniref:hypothetical protein n=1 Tax=Anaerotruncus colihominis TaxID=169435 RepID=UPI0024331F81|nr:hypothetical protein [Anaerotruncus colihominis]